MSPMSQCKMRGLHYMVRDEVSGFVCLLCGLAGDLDMIKSFKCSSSSCSSPASSPACLEKPFMRLEAEGEDEAASILATQQEQERKDRKMAEEMAELHRHESELQKMLLLHELETEEALLAGLLNERRALQLAERQATKLQQCQNSTEAASAASPPPSLDHPELPRVSDLFGEETQQSTSPPSLRFDLPYGSQAAVITYVLIIHEATII